MRGRPAEELLRLPVRLHGIQLGRPTDLIVDLDGRRVLGVDVLCGDEAHRFLPYAALTLRADELSVSSALTMLEEAELAFYRARAGTLSALRGVSLERDGGVLGQLRDLVVGDGGALEAFVVEHDGATETIAGDAGVHVAAASAA